MLDGVVDDVAVVVDDDILMMWRQYIKQLTDLTDGNMHTCERIFGAWPHGGGGRAASAGQWEGTPSEVYTGIHIYNIYLQIYPSIQNVFTKVYTDI